MGPGGVSPADRMGRILQVVLGSHLRRGSALWNTGLSFRTPRLTAASACSPPPTSQESISPRIPGPEKGHNSEMKCGFHRVPIAFTPSGLSCQPLSRSGDHLSQSSPSSGVTSTGTCSPGPLLQLRTDPRIVCPHSDLPTRALSQLSLSLSSSVPSPPPQLGVQSAPEESQ